ncbi:TPA: hypothetical protein ACOJM5_001760 [Pseudomonas putida]
MPTENRSSNTEMVSAPFKREERYIVIKVSDLASVPVAVGEPFAEQLTAIQRRLPKRECLVIESDWPEYEPAWAAIKARVTGQPAEQRQGEPVAPKLKKPRYTPTPCRFGGKDGYYQVGGVLVYDSLAEAQAYADRKNAELAQRYYEALEHTDPGEVERLRETLELVREQRDNELRTNIDLEKERDTLRAQLAERDALLRDKSGDLIRMAAHLISAPLFALQDLQDEDKKMTRARVDHAVDVADARLKDAAYELRRIADALSASAGPIQLDHEIPGTSFERLNMLANQGE